MDIGQSVQIGTICIFLATKAAEEELAVKTATTCNTFGLPEEKVCAGYSALRKVLVISPHRTLQGPGIGLEDVVVHDRDEAVAVTEDGLPRAGLPAGEVASLGHPGPGLQVGRGEHDGLDRPLPLVLLLLLFDQGHLLGDGQEGGEILVTVVVASSKAEHPGK